MSELIHALLHLDETLADICKNYGAWTYAILFLIIFAETGLIVTPFLPGDSLLFAVGALAAKGDLNLWQAMLLLFVAAVLGDSVNYSVGRRLGRGVFKDDARVLKTSHLLKTEAFYEKHGPKAIILARFVPIIRTMAPFVAGLGKMNYAKFTMYNVVGGAFWVLSMTLAGYFFGALPFVKKNFEIVVLAIIVISILPAVFEVLKARSAKAPVKPEVNAAD